MDFWGSVKDGEEPIDDLLIVGDVLLWLDVGWGFLNDFADGIREVGDDLR